jgi:hypothetical protein
LKFGAQTTVSVHPNLATPPQPATGFSFDALGGGFQQKPSTNASSTTFNMFGTTSTSTQSPFSSTSFSFGSGSNNNQSSQGNNATIAFGSSSQK